MSFVQHWTDTLHFINVHLSSNIYTFWTDFAQWSPKFSNTPKFELFALKNPKNTNLTNSLLMQYPWPIQFEKDSKDPNLKFILTMKLVHTYFSQTLPFGALISVARIRLLFEQPSTAQPPQITWWLVDEDFIDWYSFVQSEVSQLFCAWKIMKIFDLINMCAVKYGKSVVRQIWWPQATVNNWNFVDHDLIDMHSQQVEAFYKCRNTCAEDRAVWSFLWRKTFSISCVQWSLAQEDLKQLQCQTMTSFVLEDLIRYMHNKNVLSFGQQDLITVCVIKKTSLWCKKTWMEFANTEQTRSSVQGICACTSHIVSCSQ